MCLAFALGDKSNVFFNMNWEINTWVTASSHSDRSGCSSPGRSSLCTESAESLPPHGSGFRDTTCRKPRRNATKTQLDYRRTHTYTAQLFRTMPKHDCPPSPLPRWPTHLGCCQRIWARAWLLLVIASSGWKTWLHLYWVCVFVQLRHTHIGRFIDDIEEKRQEVSYTVMSALCTRACARAWATVPGFRLVKQFGLVNQVCLGMVQMAWNLHYRLSANICGCNIS